MTVGVEVYNPNLNNTSQTLITVTAAAQQHLQKEISKHQALGVRLGIKKSGCSGFKYIVDYVHQATPEDEVLAISPALQLYIERQAFPLLQGVEVDYVRVGLNGNLKFSHPRQVNTCGCGESFGLSE